MSVKRRDVRESAFLLTFEMLFRNDNIDELIEIAKENDAIIINDEVVELARGIEEKSDVLDEIISSYSNKRAVNRIPKINLAILRLASYEANYDEKVPVNVAISEAVALAEKYAYDSDISFVNGVLGAYSRSEEAPKNE